MFKLHLLIYQDLLTLFPDHKIILNKCQPHKTLFFHLFTMYKYSIHTNIAFYEFSKIYIHIYVLLKTHNDKTIFDTEIFNSR